MMNIRVVVWTIVGVVVVTGAIFLFITGKRRPTRVTVENLRFQIQRDEQSINQLSAQLAQARAVPLPQTNTQLLNQAAVHLEEARLRLEEAKRSDDIRKIEESLKQAHLSMSKCRRLLRSATRPKPAGAG
ncbi:MAG: hypothetical protein ACUVUR_00500 [bacterium]